MSNPPTLTDTGLAPFSQEAEEATIGSILMNPAAFLTVAAFLKPDDFFLLRHNYIWQAFERLTDRSEPIDPLTVSEELSNMKLLDDIGGTAYLLKLITETPTSVYAEVYGRIVERTSLRRRMLAAADTVRALAHDEEQNIETVIAEAESTILNLGQKTTQQTIPIQEALSRYYDDIQYRMEHPDAALGVPTGFHEFDRLIGGLRKQKFIIFAGRPGMAKTSLALDIAKHASKIGARGAFFTMEMSELELVQRMIASEVGIPLTSLRDACMTSAEQGRFVEAIDRLSRLNLVMDTTIGLTPAGLRSKCRRIKHEQGLDFVIIDYVQLMYGDGDFRHDRTKEIASISRKLKELSRELDCPVIALAQLNRDVEKRKDKRPMLSDLKASGGLEQDADIVTFLYRDEYYNPDTTMTPGQCDLIVAKHRDGATGTINLHFEKEYTRFLNTRRVALDDLTPDSVLVH